MEWDKGKSRVLRVAKLASQPVSFVTKAALTAGDSAVELLVDVLSREQFLQICENEIGLSVQQWQHCCRGPYASVYSTNGILIPFFDGFEKSDARHLVQSCRSVPLTFS